jgi:spore coat polysaccharide biosynthesis protein SpsF
MKTAILITARLKSTRLPMKVLKPIQGRPMISHMIDRLKLARNPGEIIICTSTEEIAEQESVGCYRGNPDDVLLRLTRAAEEFSVDTVVNCTADNPFVDPEYIDRLVDFHHALGYDYSCCRGLPLGTFSYVISYPAMLRACEIKQENDTEVWGGYFTQTGLFAWDEMPVDPEVNWPQLRLTVDTPEDFELITRIFDELYTPGLVFSLEDIVELCRCKPELVAINAGIEQKPAKPIKISGGVGEPDPMTA